jgi:hypothetical protein
MPTFTVDAEMDVDEFLCECSPKEIESLVQILKDEGHLKEPSDYSFEGSGYDAMEFFHAAKKLLNNYLRLSKEDSDTVVATAKKL